MTGFPERRRITPATAPNRELKSNATVNTAKVNAMRSGPMPAPSMI